MVTTVQGQSNRQHFLDGDHIFSLSEWTRRDGLPSWLVIDMIKARSGFIWLICDHKLVRFDGQSFKVYEPAKYDFNNTFYSALAEDRSGNIWLLSFTEDRTEIEIFDPVSEQVQPLSEYIDETVFFPSENGRDYGFFSHQGVIWVVSSAGKAWVYDHTWRSALRDTAAFATKELRWYIPTTNQQFWRHEIGTPNFHLIDSTGHTLRESQIKANHYSLDTAMMLWYMDPKHDPQQGVQLRQGLDHSSVFSQNFIPEQWIWSTKNNNQNFRINEEGYGIFSTSEEDANQLFYENELPVPNLKVFLKEHFDIERHSPIFDLGNGAFWFSTTTGLARLEVRKNRFVNHLAADDGEAHSCRGIYRSVEGEIYVNSNQGTYILSENSAPKQLYLKSQGSDNYGFGCSFFRDKLWFGMVRTSLLIYDKDKAETEEYFLKVDRGNYQYYWGSYLFSWRNDTILMCSDWGLLRVDEKGKRLLPYEVVEGIVHFSHQQQEQVWLGAEQGLYLLRHNGEHQHFQIFPDPQTPPKVYHIYEDENAEFWLATNQGLIKWRPTDQSYQQFTTADGLSDNHLHAVYPDQQGYLWLSSNYGLMRFDPQSQEVRSYFEEDGLPNNELNRVSHFRDDDGKLYFGGLSGISVFDPTQLNVQSTRRLSPVSLAEVVLFDQDNNEPNDLTVNTHTQGVIDFLPSDNRIRIGFTVPYFAKHQLQYVWRFGNDEIWNELLEPSLEIGRLPYGRHDIELGAFLVGNKSQSLVSRTLSILVHKPFYLQNWFLVLCALAFLLVIITINYASRRQLRKRNLVLEQRVQERTEKLATQNQVIAQQAAELLQLDEAKSRFFVNLSHELRTPLSLIIGPLKELQSSISGLAPAEQKHLARIARNTKKIELLVEEVMTLARLDAGQLVVQVKPIHWLTFTRRIFNSFSTRARELGIDYRYDFLEDEDLYVLVDIEKVERILNNLLSNALKFTPQLGQVSLQCEINEQLALTVSNTGSYIPEAEQALIFERYYQVKVDQFDHRTGFGIGLALSKEYTQFLQGKLSVTSSETHGTSFTLLLPKVPTAAVEQPYLEVGERLPVSVPTSEPMQQQGQFVSHLLLVEDDVDMLDYLKDLLAPHHQLTVATDGEKALEILEQHLNEIDLIVSDAMMPNLDGFALLEAVRTTYKQSLIPFILLTAMAEPGSRLRALRTGVDAYLTKPFAKAELLARIANLLQNRDQRRLFLPEPQAENIIMDKQDLSSYDELWMKKFDDVVNENLHKVGLKINAIAELLHISERTLRTQVKTNTGMSPAQYLQKARLDRAMLFLESKHFKTIAEVCYAVGIRNSSHFSRAFKKEFGKAPSEYLI